MQLYELFKQSLQKKSESKNIDWHAHNLVHHEIKSKRIAIIA